MMANLDQGSEQLLPGENDLLQVCLMLAMCILLICQASLLCAYRPRGKHFSTQHL